MIYDFKCHHGHIFEYMCKMDERNNPIPCEGEVVQVVEDELYDKYVDSDDLPEGLFWLNLNVGVDLADGESTKSDGKVLVRKVPCQLKAELFVGPHNNPGGALDHGLGSNRDAAREGRYDPLNPNRRFMAKGRSWMK